MIFIKGNVPSSKNSKRWTGHMLINSALVMKYKKETEDEWKSLKEEFLLLLEGKEKPYEIGFHFVRNSKRTFDFNNANQTICDLMKVHGWIEDDNTKVMVPFPFKINGYYDSVDTKAPGVYITVL